MLKWILFLLLCFNLYALEVSLQGAKENFKNYSTLHIKNSQEFLCQDRQDDFGETIEVVCAFNSKPSVPFKNIQNGFFKITSKMKNRTFFLIITPYEKMKLYSFVFDLSQDETTFNADVKVSKHWMLVGYIDTLPFIKDEKESDSSINFPFLLSSDTLPYVGGLDIKGYPVHIQEVGDVTDYLKIKKYYKEKKYELCLELIENVQEDYPASLFNAELLYYKIIVYAKLNDNDNVIHNAKLYLKDHSADENVAEVLSLNAKAYSLIGLSTDADYFFDRLFSEHEESKYTKWGYIYKAEMLEASGGASQALKFYKKALNETDDIDIAVTAAYKLANYYLGISNEKKASLYIDKIVKSKADFFMHDLKKSMDMMHLFADEHDFKSAATIAKAIIDATDKDHDEYERLLRDRAMWLSQTDAKLEALASINRYLEVYPDGLYDEEIRVAKDALFFDTNDSNTSVKLTHYNELIENYREDTIGNRATYEKAKLLLENEMYSDVLAIKDDILALDMQIYEEKEDIVVNAAIGMMKTSLKNKECENVITMSSDYNITLSSEWDDGIYECAMKGGDFLLSKKVAEKYLKSKDLLQRKKWLYRYIKVDFATGNYSDVLDASKDLVTLIEDDKESVYKEVYRYLFDTYQRLEMREKLVEEIVVLQEQFGLDYKDLDRYVAVMAIGSDIKDDNLVIKYGEEAMKIQEGSSSYPQSPFVEFTLYQSYLNLDENEKALVAIKSLDGVTLSKEKRARQKYMLGTIYNKLWRSDDAQKAYKEAIEADESSPWAKLAQSASEI